MKLNQRLIRAYATNGTKIPAGSLLEQDNDITGRKMTGNLAYLLDLKYLEEANEEISLVNENTGYNPYDNPGTRQETREEAD